jgi:anti-sigma regulatory factor (Ser/Thr protein kinase)
MTFVPISGGTGAGRVTVRVGPRGVSESSTPVPTPSSPSDRQVLIDRLNQAHLEMTAWPGAVPCARHHARQMLCDMGLKELIEPVELVVTEIVSNAVRASGGLDGRKRGTGEPPPVVRLWLAPERDGVLVLVWDGNSSKPQRQELPPDADSGRGLVLVEALSAAWGSFELADEPGKVVWALCQN